MTLSDLKAYMAQCGRASMTEICIHFDTTASAVAPMLDQWIAKGRLRRLDGAGACGKAGTQCSCKEPPPPVFEWLQ